MIEATDMLTIGEVAAAMGVRPSALRFYEKSGLLAPAGRRAGKRHYDRSVLRRLSLIRCAQAAGFTIPEIRKLLGGSPDAAPSKQWRQLAQRKLSEVEMLMRRAREMERWLREGLSCDCVSIDTCKLIRDEPAVVARSTQPHRRPLQELAQRTRRRK